MDKKTRVLLVDDEKDFLGAMEFWLKSEGYDVTSVLDARDAIECVKNKGADIVFLDLMMPGISGIDALKEIRAIDSDIPVIIVTAFGTYDKIREVEQFGISGFFPKEDSFEKAAKLIQTSVRMHKNLPGRQEQDT